MLTHIVLFFKKSSFYASIKKCQQFTTTNYNTKDQAKFKATTCKHLNTHCFYLQMNSQYAKVFSVLLFCTVLMVFGFVTVVYICVVATHSTCYLLIDTQVLGM